jgi:hypothetical protein
LILFDLILFDLISFDFILSISFSPITFPWSRSGWSDLADLDFIDLVRGSCWLVRLSHLSRWCSKGRQEENNKAIRIESDHCEVSTPYQNQRWRKHWLAIWIQSTGNYHKKITSGCPSELILDHHSIHQLSDIRNYMTSVRIGSWFIPVIPVDEPEPFDYLVFQSLEDQFPVPIRVSSTTIIGTIQWPG